jgi:hypothetical protein
VAKIEHLSRLHPDARAEPSAGKVHHVFDQRRHPSDRPDEALPHLHALGLRRSTYQQLCRSTNRAERVAQIVSQYSNKLLAQLADCMSVAQGRPRGLLAVVTVELRGDQLCKELKHYDGSLVGYTVGLRVDGTQVAKVGAVLANDRHRDVALQAIDPGRVVLPVDRVLAGVVEHDRSARHPGLMAERGFYLQCIACLEAEFDVVLHSASGPACIRDPGHRGEAHSGRLTDHSQNGRYGSNAPDGRHVACNCLGSVREFRDRHSYNTVYVQDRAPEASECAGSSLWA